MDWEAFYNRFREPNFIPGYEIQNRLGGGAFGEVYKARKHSIGKAYAIKFLKIDDEAQRDAVERELEQVRHFAVIDHQNLVTIEDLGTAMGVPFLIMGYAGEDTLARRLKQGGLEPEQALNYFVQACRGVLALHDRRLVHFDLKPSNIFLKGDIARVGDYGLSKMMTDGRLTLSFGRGTPHYMAPEMLKNRADHRADIYSLGVILYESFARKLPFQSAVPGTLAVREDDVPPLFPGEFPSSLRVVAERCLRLRPDDRYAGVAELLAEMGQTARPGDSVRLPNAGGSWRPVPAPSGPNPSTETRGENQGANAGMATVVTAQSGPVSSDVRNTAAELTRGAVEVARGVWDGLRAAGATRPPSGAPPLPPEALTGPRESEHTFRTPSVDRDVVALHSLSKSGEDVPLVGLHAKRASAAPRAATTAATIPVPPPVKGGWIGTVFATFALGLEVLLAVVTGTWNRGVALVARGRRSKRVGTRGFISRVVRLCLFVVFLAVLGALTTWIALTALRAT